MSIRFAESQLREQGRATRGVRGIRLRSGDIVQSMAIVDNESSFMVCTTNGYGKKTDFEEYRQQHRGGSGIKAIKTSERNGEVVEGHAVHEDDALMLVTAKGKMMRMKISDFRVIGRNTQGVRLMNMDADDTLVSASPFQSEDDVAIDEDIPTIPAAEMPPATEPPIEDIAPDVDIDPDVEK